MAPKDWWREQGVVPVAHQLKLQKQLWLLLPEDLEAPRAARVTLRAIRRRAFRAVVRGEEALLELAQSAVVADGLSAHDCLTSDQLSPGAVDTGLGNERSAGNNSRQAANYAEGA
jgi:hypothetical protein